MKKLSGIILLFILLSACEGYLDVVPDNTLTLEDLFKQKEEAWDALAKVYSYMPHIDETHNSMWTAGDEWIGRLDLNENTGHLRGIRLMRGLQTVTDPILGNWSGNQGAQPLYDGIRSANVFLEHINDVPDMSEQEKKDWSAQVTFLKAYYSFLLIRKYGPIIIAEELITSDATKDELFQRRSTVEESFAYVIRLMDEAIPNLQERAGSNLYGQIDQVAAKSIKARVLFYRASPFFNGNKEYFGDFTNEDGEPFFPLTYDNEKWKDALDALDDALEACQANGVELYRYSKEPYVFDREDFKANEEKLQTLYDLRMVVTDPWNKELIWGYSNLNFYGQGELAHSSNIRLPEGYGGGVTNTASYSWQWMASTYRMTERYYTENGVPIEEDLTFDVDNKWELTTTPGAEDEDYDQSRGYMQPGAETINLYLNREPRFYANLGITGGYWRSHSVRINTMMYAGSDGGYNSSQHSTDFLVTGIGVKKLVHPESKSGAWQRTIKYPYPIIRFADLLLMKAEALNEYNSSPTQEVYDLVNQVRKRAGIPDLETVWSDPDIVKTVNKHKSKEGMRDIILRERGIEFAFEGQRFWDMIRTKRAVSEFSSPAWGWNHTGETGASFFNLEVKQARQFTITDNLWPIDLNEINTNSNLVQNPGW
ncbi:RagB/SusD family nutrient uptake outer membrane protein [Membranicola marinus]|uniref:RagB/SusD family nutrient uptake outer membrane protein n=1 Tax=Membranihabitans marinus TaxID=1227546 RepID=A0A953HTY9_9BACT|nr:RagB/SusD family nutrient uptake outer membrane protein [Membranihabitans marinus]MBY5958385.1 RagB/SusD family nutrient uptake outer membrane protein [Membranihabitans marinus]